MSASAAYWPPPHVRGSVRWGVVTRLFTPLLHCPGVILPWPTLWLWPGRGWPRLTRVYLWPDKRGQEATLRSVTRGQDTRQHVQTLGFSRGGKRLPPALLQPLHAGPLPPILRPCLARRPGLPCPRPRGSGQVDRWVRPDPGRQGGEVPHQLRGLPARVSQLHCGPDCEPGPCRGRSK